MEQFSSKPWFPIGIVKETTQNKSISLFQHYNVHTEFGTLDMFNIENFDDIKVFNELIKNIETLDDFEIWGDFNYSETFEKIEIKESKKGINFTISNKKNTIQGIFHNFPVSSWRRKWSELEKSPLLLIPTGGIQWKGLDVFVFRKSIKSKPIKWKSESSAIFSDMGEILGKFHTKMLETSAPRMEKEWNSRLKRLETISSSGTLWRAPHSKNTDSIRSLGDLNLNDWRMVNDEVTLDLLNLGFQSFEGLVTKNNRFSCLRDLASLYVEIDNSSSFSGNSSKGYLRKLLFESWKKQAPKKWYSKSALDGNLGGMQIWRYDVELRNLFLARVFDIKYNKKWIKGVKDIQRNLFNYRIISGSALGMLLSSTTIALLWPNLSIGIKIFILGAGISIYSIGMRVYRNTSLPPY